MDSDDPSLAQVLERLEDVRKGSTLVTLDILTRLFHYDDSEENVLSIVYINIKTPVIENIVLST